MDMKINKKIYGCPVTFALSMLNGKWKLPIIWEIHKEESIRFNELQRRLEGISNLMLSKSLQALESDNLINRHQYNEIPPRVEYSLTNSGKSLIPALDLLGEWGKIYLINPI